MCLAIPGTALASTSAPTHIAASRSPHCDPTIKTTFRQIQWKWKSFDGGEINNSSKRSSVTKTFQHSRTYSLSSTVEAGSHASLKVLLAEAGVSLKISISGSASFTKGQIFSVTAGPKSNVAFRDGVIQRIIQVKTHTLFSNCDTKDDSSILRAADNYSSVKDI
jgi:hypothetical protein